MSCSSSSSLSFLLSNSKMLLEAEEAGFEILDFLFEFCRHGFLLEEIGLSGYAWFLFENTSGRIADKQGQAEIREQVAEPGVGAFRVNQGNLSG